MKEIEKIIGYEFKDNSLLSLALTHSSFLYKKDGKDNERLEFLGDSIIGFVVAEFLAKNFSQNEGMLTKYRSCIVSCSHLSEIVTSLGLNKFLKVNSKDLKDNESVKGDFCEALIGAIYLDSNLDECKKFIYNFLNLTKENVLRIYNENVDYKSVLQEKVQAKKGTMEYILISQSGLDNNRTFEMELIINGKSVCKQISTSKQKTENECAKIALQNLENYI